MKRVIKKLIGGLLTLIPLALMLIHPIIRHGAIQVFTILALAIVLLGLFCLGIVLLFDEKD